MLRVRIEGKGKKNCREEELLGGTCHNDKPGPREVEVKGGMYHNDTPVPK